jgi:hypothetical protein
MRGEGIRMTKRVFLRSLGVLTGIPAIGAMADAPETPNPPVKPGVDIEKLLSSMVDRRREALYDRLRLKAGETVPHLLHFFITPVGSVCPYSLQIKTFADTNMLSPGYLSPPHDMVVERIGLIFQPSTSEEDRQAVLRSFYVEWIALQKVLIRVPALSLAAVAEAGDLIDLGKRGTSQIHKLGKHYWHDLGETRKYLPPEVSFKTDLRNDTMEPPHALAADFDMYVFLDGVRSYPVQ